MVFVLNITWGSTCVNVDMQLEMKPVTKEFFAWTKAIPTRA